MASEPNMDHAPNVAQTSSDAPVTSEATSHLSTPVPVAGKGSAAVSGTITSKGSSSTGSTKAKTKTKTKVKATVGGAKVRVGSDGDEQETRSQARNGAKFIGGVLVIYIIYLIISGQMGTFIEALGSVSMPWLVAAGICYLFYFIFGVGAYVVAVWLDPDSPVGVRDLMSVEASGVFFGNLTPMMMGSVPSQVYRLTRTGLDVGEATATQLSRFIMFQVGEVLFSAILLLARFDFFLHTYGDIVFLNLVIFLAHVLQLAGLFVVCLCPKLVMRIGNAAIKFVSKRGWFKNADYAKWYDMVNNQVTEFSDAFKRSAAHLPSMGLTLVVTMAQLASLYIIPWFVLNAFGHTGDFISCMAAASMVQLVATAVPLPGGTGGAESGFALFFGPMFGASVTAGFLVWRIVTFFAPTILAAPLLSLRSKHPESIYQRWNNLRTGSRSRGAALDMSKVRAATHKASVTVSKKINK